MKALCLITLFVATFSIFSIYDCYISSNTRYTFTLIKNDYKRTFKCSKIAKDHKNAYMCSDGNGTYPILNLEKFKLTNLIAIKN